MRIFPEKRGDVQLDGKAGNAEHVFALPVFYLHVLNDYAVEKAQVYISDMDFGLGEPGKFTGGIRTDAMLDSREADQGNQTEIKCQCGNDRDTYGLFYACGSTHPYFVQ